MRLSIPLSLIALASSGCATLENASSGQIGCPADEILISDHQRGWNTSTWTATCREREFMCSAVSGGQDSLQVACKEAMPSVATPAPQSSGGESVPVAASSGCQYDTQCKGDRICREGACVDPVVPAAPPVVAPSPSVEPATPAS